MKLEEIWLNENDTDMLSDLLKAHNQDLTPSQQKTYQEYAEDLLKDAIYHQYQLLKADR